MKPTISAVINTFYNTNLLFIYEPSQFTCVRYGGGQQFRQPWPIEQQRWPETAYVTADMLQVTGRSYGGVSEAYWVSSTGLAVVVSTCGWGLRGQLGLLGGSCRSGEYVWLGSPRPTGSSRRDLP